MKELTLPAAKENIPDVIDFVNRELESVGCPMKTEAQIDIAIDELYSNIANYGCDENSGEVTVLLETETDSRTVTITFVDNGRPFDPLSRPDPDVTLKARERKIGGLGIFMTKKTMDEVRYERLGDNNVLTLIKRV